MKYSRAELTKDRILIQISPLIMRKDIHARPDACKDENGDVVKVARRVGRPEGRCKAQRSVKRDISGRYEKRDREYTKGLN